MYVKEKWTFPDSNEYEYKWVGRYGAPGEKRGARTKATPEQIEKQNQRIREKKMRRLIKANFTKNDLWLTLKYPKGERPDVQTVKKDIKDFLGFMRKQYKKRGEDFKFIYRMEIGSRGGVHVHMLINRISGEPGTDLLVQEGWKVGRYNMEHLYNQGSFSELSAYIVKQPSQESQRHINNLPEGDRKEMMKYSSSRNLIRPKPVEKKYKRTVKKLVKEGPKPTEGYYIDKSSIVSGTNPYTGMSYMYYTEVKLPPG